MGYICDTNLKPGNTTTFYLNVTFTGDYDDTNCGVSFNIKGNNGDMIYHLDFRINSKGSQKTIAQDAFINGIWQSTVFSDMPYLKYSNDVFLGLTPEFYHLTMNENVVQPQFKMDFEKLKDYTNILIIQGGACFTIGFNNSYMQNIGEPILLIKLYNSMYTF